MCVCVCTDRLQITMAARIPFLTRKENLQLYRGNIRISARHARTFRSFNRRREFENLRRSWNFVSNRRCGWKFIVFNLSGGVGSPEGISSWNLRFSSSSRFISLRLWRKTRTLFLLATRERSTIPRFDRRVLTPLGEIRQVLVSLGLEIWLFDNFR